jgi:hypothetical protein
MIVVLGRPRAARSSPLPDATTPVPAGMSVAIAGAAVAAGARVELVGSIGDDDAGDAVVVGLSRAGIGHAALLRDPEASTPGVDAPPGALPRLERADVELGLGYLADFRVVVLAEPLEPEAESAAIDGAAYHGAHIVAIQPAGTTPSNRLAAVGTVLEAPIDDGGAFQALVGRFAAELERGVTAAEGFTRATVATGWEHTA